MRRISPLLFLQLVTLGCGGGEPAMASKEPHITMEEWRRLPPEERDDPYVKQRLLKPGQPAPKR